jgi:ATP-dependent RNA helicase DeaD
MGREGIAYTFVTTEEGGELTRIEILINRLLKRDEIEGFAAVATVAPLPDFAVDAASSGERPNAAPGEEPPSPKPPRPAPPGRRPMKRHRRAL